MHRGLLGRKRLVSVVALMLGVAVLVGVPSRVVEADTKSVWSRFTDVVKHLRDDAKDTLDWVRDKWASTADEMKQFWAKNTDGEWWKSCRVCDRVPAIGKQPCRNVCAKIRRSYERETPTKYPIVILHGLVRAPIGRYFFGVPEYLNKHGFDASVPTMSSWNTPEQHVRFLLPYIKGVLRRTGAAKVNLIGHSQGGLDARAVAALGGAPFVASVTALMSPHRGAIPADDFVAKIERRSGGATVADLLLRAAYPGVEGGARGNFDSIRALTTSALKKFNRRIKDQPGVKYFSYSGSSHPKECPNKDNATFANVLQSGLVSTWKVIHDKLGEVHNDGQVHHDSARWGEFLGDLPSDHWDLGGLPFGLNDYDYLDFFLRHARLLRERGF
ncbi:MAG: hypothetical protein HYY84_13120 [Deltaproteobacteria bacterium]|nr:hypothetical protein [Deltaproteobacteria bacterium]